MNYGELKTAVAEYSHRPDLAARIPGFIRLAEGLMARELRSMEQVTRLTLAEADRVADGLYALPASVLEIRAVWHDLAGRTIALEQISPSQIRRRNSSTRPTQYAVLASGIEIRGVPPVDAEFQVEYLSRFEMLQDDADTNALLTAHEALYLYGALFHLYQFTQDLELASAAIDTFQGAVDRLNEQAGRKMGGASIAGAYNLYGGGGTY